MNVARLFIRRPIGTALMAIGLFLVGAVAYVFLPVASLPSIDFPTIYINASRPGADPKTMAATMAAPIERRLGEISGVKELTSVNSIGSSLITVQFDLGRNIDAAARDVQAALNAALKDLPSDLPALPTFHKANPNAPILILALTSRNLTPSAVYAAADSVMAQRLSQIPGVGDVSVAGSDQPAIRVSVDPIRLASLGLSLEDVRSAIVNADAIGPLGSFDGNRRAVSIGSNSQLETARDYDSIVVKANGETVIQLGDVATVTPSVRDNRSASWYNRDPSVLVFVSKQANANSIDTVNHIYSLLPKLQKWLPAGIDMSVLVDRTQTIRASVLDMQLTLGVTIILVMLIVMLFLRRAAPMMAVGVAIPLSLAGTSAAMWAAGFSIDNISLLALVVCIAFVADETIVMVENTFRHLERGASPLRASLKGAQQIGLTVLTISISLIAAFIPLLFLGGIVGRTFREFSVTLVFAILTSTIISLSVTPMICAHFVRRAPSRDATSLDRLVEGVLSQALHFYDRSLEVVITHRMLTFVIFLGTTALAIGLFIKTPKGYLPSGDTGLIYAGTDASSGISFKAMKGLEKRAIDVVLADPAVDGVGTNLGDGLFGAATNRGRMFIDLKPLAGRHNTSIQQVAARLRLELDRIPGIRAWTVPVQDVASGGNLNESRHQLTLWSSDVDLLQEWAPKILARVKKVPGVDDVISDGGPSGLQAKVNIDRFKAAKLGVSMSNIDSILEDAFSQRQISTIYTSRNQYKVILDVAAKYRRDPDDLNQVYVPGTNGEVPLSAFANYVRTLAPQAVNHRGQFPSITITYDLLHNASIQRTTSNIAKAISKMDIPDPIHWDFAGDILAFKRFVGVQPLLLLMALVAVYIVLGVRYDSLAHQLTIISTLPSAGLGALLALQVSGSELSAIAFVGIILLIGIVKKNGIMMVDFALEAQHKGSLSPREAIHAACLQRFRPILMTTLAAMLGALPLLIAGGPGAELRRPLGITIIGGLLVSQALTLYTTPVIYLFLNKLHYRLGGETRSVVRRRLTALVRGIPSGSASKSTRVTAPHDYAEVD